MPGEKREREVKFSKWGCPVLTSRKTRIRLPDDSDLISMAFKAGILITYQFSHSTRITSKIQYAYQHENE